MARTPFARRIRGEVSDYLLNRQWRDTDADLLVIRHPQSYKMNESLLQWLGLNFPQLRRRIDLRLLPVFGLGYGVESPGFDPGRYKVAISWLQDPIPGWSSRVEREAVQLANRLQAQHLPIVNHPAALANAEKTATAEIASTLGVRTPRTAALEKPGDLEAFQDLLKGPVIIRSDWLHGETMLRLATGEQLPWPSIESMRRPIAVEFIDTSDEQGRFWKYRYLGAGPWGISVHLLASGHWEVRGGNRSLDTAELEREGRFLATPNPGHEIFQGIRLALGLDVVALDYSLDHDGSIVLWESNPCPGIGFGLRESAFAYRDAAVHRCYAALTGAYLDKAGIAVPEEMQRLRSYSADSATILARLQIIR